MVGHYQRSTVRVYHYCRREESQALEVPPLALGHWADLVEEAGRFRPGSGASALCHHRGNIQALEVPPSALAHAAAPEEEAGHSRQ